MFIIICFVHLEISVASDEDAPADKPTITITEDESMPAEDADFVKYFGLEQHTEGTPSLNLMVKLVIVVARTYHSLVSSVISLSLRLFLCLSSEVFSSLQ